jgi:hypothetical protein
MPDKKSLWGSTAVILIAFICGGAITITAIFAIIISPAAHTSRHLARPAPVTLATAPVTLAPVTLATAPVTLAPVTLAAAPRCPGLAATGQLGAVRYTCVMQLLSYAIISGSQWQ